MKHHWVLLVCAITGSVTTAAEGGPSKPTDGGFAIYACSARLPQYDRGPEWEMFYQRGALTRRLVADEDIDAYDWDNQAIILTEAASGRVNLKAQSFIATLDGRRLYGGRGISRMSQMAVRYPVIYTDSVEGRTVLLVRPLHDLAGRPDLRDKAWELIASPEVMAHFKKLGKLRRPWSGGSFIRMQKSACRIRGLRVAQTESAIEAEYDIEGTRLGEYQVREEICWIGGKVRGSLGPVHETRVTPSSQRVHRKVAFPFHALARAYDGFAAGLTADGAKAPSWRVSVLLLPEWSKDETASLDLVERINLKLLRGYGLGRVDPLHHGPGEEWLWLEDFSVAELPVHWERVKRARSR